MSPLFVLILIILIVFVELTKNNFENVNPSMNDNYECNENKRLFPEGKIPGNYLGLNKYNLDNLTKKFNVTSEELFNNFIKVINDDN
jgi:hypothetical protein